MSTISLHAYMVKKLLLLVLWDDGLEPGQHYFNSS